MLKKTGSPTGTANVTIRKSDDSIAATIGTVDVSTLTTSARRLYIYILIHASRNARSIETTSEDSNDKATEDREIEREFDLKQTKLLLEFERQQLRFMLFIILGYCSVLH